jgi:hypothetical protein
VIAIKDLASVERTLAEVGLAKPDYELRTYGNHFSMLLTLQEFRPRSLHAASSSTRIQIEHTQFIYFIQITRHFVWDESLLLRERRPHLHFVRVRQKSCER